MTDPLENFRAAWREISASRAEKTQIIRGFESEGGEVRLHQDMEGCLHLLIPLGEGQEVPDRHSTRGLILREINKAAEGGDVLRFMDLACMRSYYNDVFRSMVEEILNQTLAGTTFLSAVPDVIHRFKEMLKNFAAPLGRDATLGLIGELITLRSIVKNHAVALQNWKGPSGAHQDFISPAVALEVKSSAKHRREARITSYEQLDPPAPRELFLVLHQFDEANDEGHTIPGLYDEIVSLGVNREQFEAMLGAAGYDHFDRESYEAHTFKLIDSFYYQVDESFPRIVAGSFKEPLPQVITPHGYSVDLEGDTPPVLAEIDARNLIDRLALIT